MKKYNSHSKRYNAKKPVYKTGNKVVSKALGLSLLTEKVFGKKISDSIYDKATNIGYLALEYGCLGSLYRAATRYQKKEHIRTATGMALAGLALIVVKKGIECAINKS